MIEDAIAEKANNFEQNLVQAFLVVHLPQKGDGGGEIVSIMIHI